MNSKSEKLNVKGLSRAFGVSQITVRNWICKGIPCDRTSKGYRFDLSECIRWREKFLKDSQRGNDAFEAAKTERQIYLAKMAKLRFEQEAKKFVEVKEVSRLWFETGRLMRDSLLNIPARVSPILAAERDPKKVHEILDKELREALENLCDEIRESEVKNGTNKK